MDRMQDEMGQARRSLTRDVSRVDMGRTVPKCSACALPRVAQANSFNADMNFCTYHAAHHAFLYVLSPDFTADNQPF